MPEVSQDLAPSHVEKKTEAPLVQTKVQVPPNPEYNLHEAEEQVNGILAGFYSCQAIAYERIQQPIKIDELFDAEGKPTENFRKARFEMERIQLIEENILTAAQGNPEVAKKLHNDAILIDTEVPADKKTTDIVELKTDQEEPFEKHKDIAAQLISIRDNVDLVSHELRKPITAGLGTLQLMDMRRNSGRELNQELCDRINEIYARIYQFLRNEATEILLDQFPKDTISTDGLKDNIHATFITASLVTPEDMKINIKEIPQELVARDIIWSKKYSSPLWINLVANASEQYDVRDRNEKYQDRKGQPRTLEVEMEKAPQEDIEKYKLDSEKEYLKIRVKDQATGVVNPEAAKLEGVSDKGDESVKGTGTGLKGHREKIAQYGGEIALVNRKDMPGAEIWVFMPLVQYDKAA